MTVEENAASVLPGSIHKPEETLSGNNDHRIVMALSVLAMQTGGTIQGAQAIQKSYPNFFEDLKSIGGKVDLSDEEVEA